MTLVSVDDVASEFTIEFGFTMEWHIDPLPQFIHASAEVEEDPQTAWKPDLVYVNAVSVPEPRAEHIVRKGETVYYTYLGKGTFREILELERFPFDRQLLHVEICHRKTQSLHFINSLSSPPTMLSQQTQWECKDPTIELFSKDKIYGTPGFFFVGKVQRKPAFYMWNVCFPLFLIVALSTLATVVPAEDISARLGLTLTLFLTATAFKIIITNYLPRTNYLTLLDIYAVVSFVLLALMGLENAIAYKLRDVPCSSSSSCGRLLDIAVVEVGGLLFIALHAVGLVFSYKDTFRVPWDKLDELQEGDSTVE
eukprot:TRINITY_DN3081_c0_g1_i2.p1 TRINITY_DN3081_c0_g1~~TRINITY_DN3081_c0_g1_i2.p1  ORF type:complete len:310 (+),score=69.77 TRINITY_DN3081_c0_g1_i2:541-1470(+)